MVLYAVSHVHQDIADDSDISALAAEFAGRSQIREALFDCGQ